MAAGLFNTHCDFGDARLETLAACAGAEGASKEQVRELLSLPLAEEAVPLLRQWGLSSVFPWWRSGPTGVVPPHMGGAVPLGVAVLSLDGEVLGSFPEIGKEARPWTELPSSA